MEHTYIAPQTEVIRFGSLDVICTSETIPSVPDPDPDSELDFNSSEIPPLP